MSTTLVTSVHSPHANFRHCRKCKAEHSSQFVDLFRPIWRRVPSADGPVGRWDGPSANILSRLQMGRCSQMGWNRSTPDQGAVNYVFYGSLPLTLTRCSGQRDTYDRTLAVTLHCTAEKPRALQIAIVIYLVHNPF